jgi:hypothetical protein
MKTMIHVGKRSGDPRAGMTLAELMVAAGILAVITVFSAQVMGDVSRVWLGGKGRSDTFIAARALMTRMRIDIERSLPLLTLPGFAKDPSGENLAFSTRVQGVLATGGGSGADTAKAARPLSFVRYRLGSPGSDEGGYLVREDRPFQWDESPFGADEGSAKARRLCPNVVGYQYRFVRKNGEMSKTFSTNMVSGEATVALRVSLAVADDRAFQTMKLTGTLSQVTESFSSLEPETWEEALGGTGATMPPEARKGVRVFHQVVALPTAGREE